MVADCDWLWWHKITGSKVDGIFRAQLCWALCLPWPWVLSWRAAIYIKSQLHLRKRSACWFRSSFSQKSLLVYLLQQPISRYWSWSSFRKAFKIFLHVAEVQMRVFGTHTTIFPPSRNLILGINFLRILYYHVWYNLNISTIYHIWYIRKNY